MIVNNTKGITLVEVLITVVLMAIILTPVTLIVMYSLKTEQQVSAKNEVQREARFIMEYITEKMRDKNILWVEDGSSLQLCLRNGATCGEVYLTYNEETNQILLGSAGNVLSEHATLEIVGEPPNPSEIILTIEKLGESVQLKSMIYYNRF